jgi:AraC family transcriptional regulator
MVTTLARGAFFGRTYRCRNLGGITLTESLYGPNVVIPPHAHMSAYFDVVLEGDCHEVVDGRTRERGRWSLAFHPAGEVHADRWHAGAARNFQIEVATTLLDHARAYGANLDRPAHFAPGPSQWLVQRLYDEFRSADSVSALAVEGLTVELFAATARSDPADAQGTAPYWLRQVCDLLHDRFHQRLTLENIAGSVGVHPGHLARVFRRLHHCTVGDYVHKLRVEHACHRLSTSNASLAMIALEAGFSDQSHFSTVFKRQTGMSPAVFRKSTLPRKSHARSARIAQEADKHPR